MELFLAIAAIVLAVVLWVAPPEPLRRWIRQLRVLFGSHPAAAVQTDMSMFDGRVELLTQHLLSRSANAVRKRQYYEAEGPLDWDIIAAQADVERDQQVELLTQLSGPVASLRIVCLLGESGIGKSTLAWRLAAELYKRHRALVVRVKGWDAPEVWYRMPEFSGMVQRPLIVLADDLFRDPDVCIALQQLSPWLPITVLATSQTHEYRPGRLKGEVTPIPITKVSSGEKERALVRFGKDAPGQSALMAADDFLVLMAELTSGKGFQSIVQESLNSLARQHPPICRAYEYVCFAYSYGIAVPISILERLDAQGNLHDLPNREGARGLIFRDETHPDCVRPGHRKRAELASILFQKVRPPTLVLEELVRAANASTLPHRRFVAHVLRSVALGRVQIVKEIRPRIEEQVATCVRQASTISELALWRQFYLSVGSSVDAERLVDAALALKPVTSQDLNVALYLFRERRREHDALPILLRFVQHATDWGGCGPAFLTLVEKYGTETDLAQAIDRAGVWLATHRDDTVVRTAYLGLVERKGTDEQTQRVMKETGAWLVTHANAEDVWTRLFSYLIALKTLEDARALAEEIVAVHPANSNLVSDKPSLGQDEGQQANTKQLYECIVKLSPRSPSIMHVWAGWLVDAHYRGEAETVFKDLIANNPKWFQPRYDYGRLLLDEGRIDEAEKRFRETLEIHRGHAMAHDGLAMALNGLARRAEGPSDASEAQGMLAAAEDEFKRAIYWAGVAGARKAIFFTHLGWFYIDGKRWTDALGAFDQAADENPEYFGNYWGKGRALAELKQWRNAAQALRMALKRAPETLGPPASDDIPKLLQECQTALTSDGSAGSC